MAKAARAALEEKFKTKIDKWPGLVLSKKGRLTLAQSVIQSLLCYFFSLLKALSLSGTLFGVEELVIRLPILLIGNGLLSL